MNVLLVGMGGLGCPASLALAELGVRQLTLVDPDVVELSNLHRQLWYGPDDLGQKKVEVAARRLERAFPTLEVRPLALRVDAANAAALLQAHDAALDGTDSPRARFELSDAAVAVGTPLIHGGVLGWQGQCFKIRPGGPCLRCLFEGPPVDAPTCASAGVMGSVAGVIGAAMARAVVAPPRADDAEPLFRFNGKLFQARHTFFRRSLECSQCNSQAARLLRSA